MTWKLPNLDRKGMAVEICQQKSNRRIMDRMKAPVDQKVFLHRVQSKDFRRDGVKQKLDRSPHACVSGSQDRSVLRQT
jgi:hypothetical protein